MGSRSIQFLSVLILALSSHLILANAHKDAKQDLLAGNCDRFPTAKQECKILHEIVTHPAEMLKKDPQVLTKTMLKFAIAYGSDAKAHIRLLLNKFSNDKGVRTSLQSCSASYNAAVLRLKETLSALKSKSVDPSYYAHANEQIVGAMNSARQCVDGWEPRAQILDAISKFEKTFLQACRITLDSVNQLAQAKSAAATAVASSLKI